LSATEHTLRYLAEAAKITAEIDPESIERIVCLLRVAREQGGRIFFLGVGGGAGNATHAVNDFRKTAGIECYSPSDNVSELTARINDESWETAYADWLRGSHLRADDIVFVFSVGGGSLERKISVNLVKSMQLAKEVGAKIVGIVGRDGGYTAKVGDEVIIISTISADLVTAHTESLQATLWHCIVTHPDLKLNEMKWESGA
jgi:D-sedoheptulose 7-phosphate isomerase